MVGASQLASFALTSTPALADTAKPLKVAVIAQQMSAQSDQRSWAGFQQWLGKTGLDKVWQVNQTDAKGDPGTVGEPDTGRHHREIGRDPGDVRHAHGRQERA